MLDKDNFKKSTNFNVANAAAYTSSFDKYNMLLYVGDLNSFDIKSDPIDYNLDLNDYNYFGMCIYQNTSSVLKVDFEKTLNLDNLGLELASNLIFNHHKEYMQYKNVSIKTAETIYDRLKQYHLGAVVEEQIAQKTGGNCKRCGAYDEYAPLDKDGKCYCYKCFV